MFCSKCGAKNEDNSMFCYQCGNRFEETNSANQQQPQTPADNYTYNQPQGPVGQQQSAYQQGPVYSQQGPVYSQPQMTNYGQTQGGAAYQQPNQPYYQPQTPQGQNAGMGIKMPVKSKKPLFIGLAGIVAVALVIFIFIKIASPGNGKVLDNILNAAQGTMEAGSVEITMETVDNYSGRNEEKAEGIIVFDLDKEEIGYDIKFDDGDRSILYNETMYDVEDDEVWWEEDYSREIEELFQYYDEYKGAFKGLSDVDWEDAIDEAGLSMFVDTDELEKCLNKFEKNLNSKEYFEKVCEEFSVEKTSKGTKYTLDVDVPKLVESLIETFEPVIEYDLDDVMDEVMDEVDIFDQFLVEITIKDNKLSVLHLDITMEDYEGDKQQNELTMEFENYGKASLDEDEIEEVISNKYEWE